jgi:simple sugar transport system permease protein
MIRIEKRQTPQASTTILVAIAAILLALLISTIVLSIMGYKPIEIFSTTFSQTYLTVGGIQENLLMLIPLSLCAVAVAVAAKAGLWNIGVEGQFFVGAAAATGVELAFPNLPAPILLIMMFLAATAAAGLICYISTLPRIYFGISEILTTILMNSVVIFFVRYLVNVAWDDPATVAAQTPPFVEAARLPILLPDSRLHIGFLVAIGVIIFVHYFVDRTVYGYEMRAVGENVRGAKYAGINIKKYFFIAMFLSGCLAGAAGMLEVSGVVHRLQPTISADYGFSAFVIAWVARLGTGAILIISYLFAGLLVAGFKMQMMGLPSMVISMLKGLILLLVLAGEILTVYKFSWASKNPPSPRLAEETVDTINLPDACNTPQTAGEER